MICIFRDCIFSACDLVYGLGLGILSSVIVAMLTWIISKIKFVKKLKDKFGFPAGSYLMAPNDWMSAEDVENRSFSPHMKIPTAEIEYLHDNLLKIYAEPADGRNWQGIISMETRYSGSVSWEYVDPLPTDTGKGFGFGFKRLIVQQPRENAPKRIFLIGEVDKGYGEEVLIERETKTKPKN